MARRIELLAPAKDIACGKEAIRHGADAVYIGAAKFGARTAAGNTTEEIRDLCEFAHLFGARVYVAFNTILKDNELEYAEQLIWQLYEAGVDALIIQDMGICQLNLPPIPLHASTQTDNRTVEKVRFFQEAGFTQVVLARELSIDEIRAIANQTTVPLEVFVHGSLCVSYSGQCYLSSYLCGRSANRGECAQYCRLPYTMTDANGAVIVKDKHLLSLKDMNRSSQLEELLDAGVSSLKIEGRLKDIAYVKNITAYYRHKLDEILDRRPEFERSSFGISEFGFKAVADKSFNRGYTPFFLHGRIPEITSFDTPKWIGEPVGSIKEIKENHISIQTTKKLNNGDGLTFFNADGSLEGFRVNRVDGDRIYPLEMPHVRRNSKLFRNYDCAFENKLLASSAKRKLSAEFALSDNPFGFTLSMFDETGAHIMLTFPFQKEVAKTDQEDNIRKQISKLGDTPFVATEVKIELTDKWFIPSSIITKMRCRAVNKIVANHRIRYRREMVASKGVRENKNKYPEDELTYLGNVSNKRAKEFYMSHGINQIAPAFELSPNGKVPLMFARHCLKYSMGWCPKQHKERSPYKEPYYLSYKSARLRLSFDCEHCQMLVLSDTRL